MRYSLGVFDHKQAREKVAMPTMNGLWLEQGTLRYRSDLERPAPADGEALVRVRVAGVCSTDLELQRGYMPFTGVPGHEFVGEIESCPSEPQRVGERVVGSINAVCGVCDMCVAGMERHCRDRTVLGILGRNGAFAQFLTLPAGNLHRVPKEVSDDKAVFCEPLAAAIEVLEQWPFRHSERVLLVGAGRLGQLLARVLPKTGCQLDVLARHPRKRDALSALQLRPLGEAPEPRSYDVAVEASGSADGLAIALSALRPRGALILKSTFAGETSLDMSRLVVDEITLIGSRCGPMEKALELMAEGDLDLERLIDERLELARGKEAFERAARREVIKVLVEM
jgi:2-desacetyl-2-hydroxyethyl bacteriochlorophyllide A dehydrogenase